MSSCTVNVSNALADPFTRKAPPAHFARHLHAALRPPLRPVSEITHCPRWKLAALFFISASGMAMWSVPFGNVLRMHHLESIIGYAYACSDVAAFISPLAAGVC
jgi:hypothetical protein